MKKQTFFVSKNRSVSKTPPKVISPGYAYSPKVLENGVLRMSRKTFEFDPAKPIILAGFDIDGTLVVTKSGYVFARGGNDWKLMPHITHFAPLIQKLKDDNPNHQCVFVLFTNQSSTLQKPESKSHINLLTKVGGIFDALKIIDLAFASLVTTTPVKEATNRKPHLHMFNLFKSMVPQSTSIDLEKSFFVGDAAGREGDHSDVDRMFAKNAEIRFFTPEEYFLPLKRDSDEVDNEALLKDHEETS